MEDQLLIGIDVGTTKVCTLVAREEAQGQLRILGVGIEPSQGLRKGVVVDLEAAAQAVARSVDKAERTSGVEILSALVSLAGSNVSSVNSRGVVGVTGRVIDHDDVARAVDAARAVAIPHNREIVHVIQRSFDVDGQDGIRMPIGMHGYRLEVETHIITATAASVENLRQCIGAAGVEVAQFVLNPLASGEVVLNETERQMGTVVCDVGGGTTDMAIFVDGDVWHTAVLSIGGNHITSDIAQVLHLPNSQAEEIKLQHGHANPDEIDPGQYFNVRPFGEDDVVQVSHKDLVQIIYARVEEIFGMVVQEIKRSGYDGLLPAGMVLTGGTSALPGIHKIAGRVLGVPVRIAQPDRLIGMTDRLESPAFSTSVGLLRWATLMSEVAPQGGKRRRESLQGSGPDWDNVRNWLKRLLP
ncbi:MAG: cell division protein FtsA [Chloroflexi bacterium RBG_16_57_11]|nr:MAG: cell division protein FtsA [Chloroflexi bacterium RBG_16_57_11]